MNLLLASRSHTSRYVKSLLTSFTAPRVMMTNKVMRRYKSAATDEAINHHT